MRTSKQHGSSSGSAPDAELLLAPALLAALVAPASQRPEPRFALVGADVFDGSGGQPQPATVLVRGERIEAVTTGTDVPSGYRVVDARGHTLLPGLFDLHTHLGSSAVGGLEGDLAQSLLAYLRSPACRPARKERLPKAPREGAAGRSCSRTTRRSRAPASGSGPGPTRE